MALVLVDCMTMSMYEPQHMCLNFHSPSLDFTWWEPRQLFPALL